MKKAIDIKTTVSEGTALMSQDPANRPEIEGYTCPKDRAEVLGAYWHGAYDAVAFAHERGQALPTDYLRKKLDSLWTTSKRNPAEHPLAAFAEEAFEEAIRGFRQAQKRLYPNAKIDWSSYKWEKPRQPWLVF